MESAEKECPFCAEVIKVKAIKCKHCGEMLADVEAQTAEGSPKTPDIPQKPNDEIPEKPMRVSHKSRSSAIFLALFFGWLGGHRFYIGDIGKGLLYLIFSWTYIPLFISIWEAFSYWRTGNDEIFNRLYVEKQALTEAQLAEISKANNSTAKGCILAFVALIGLSIMSNGIGNSNSNQPSRDQTRKTNSTPSTTSKAPKKETFPLTVTVKSELPASPKVVVKNEGFSKTQSWKNSKFALEKGKYQLEVTSEGYKPFQKSIEIPKNKNIAVSLTKDPEYWEKKKQEELKKTGIWRVGHYVDEFGASTAKAYVTNHANFSGTFSNTATQNSELEALLLIDSEKMSLQLYEYAGDNPVKAYSEERYSVRVRDANQKTYDLHASNYDDRLVIDKSDEATLHNILKRGGRVSFRIDQLDFPTSYNFSIPDAKYYGNAYRMMTEGGK